MLSRHASKFMNSCITYRDRLHSIFSKKKRSGHVGQGALCMWTYACMTRVQSWFLVGSKGHMHTFAAKLFLAKQSNMCGTGWEEIVGSQFTHRLCSCSARTCTDAPAAAESVVVWLPSLDFQAEWRQKDGHGRRPGCPAYATGGHLRTCRLCPCKCMYLHAKRGCFLRLFFHYNF